MEEEFSFEKKKIWKQPKFLIGTGLIGLLALILFFGGKISGENSRLENFSAAAFETLSDVFGFQKEKPIYELDLTTGVERNLSLDGSFDEENNVSSPFSQKKDSSINKKPNGTKKGVASSSKNSDFPDSKKSNSSSVENNEPASSQKNSSLSGTSISQSPQSQNNFRDCPFSSSGNLNHEIVFNEIVWMGSSASANDEWIELKSNSPREIDLSGRQIKNSDESIKIVFGSGEKILAGSLFLLERTDDTSAPQVAADKIYVGAISNSGEWLKLFDATCNLVDEVNATASWESFGGDNTSKKTLERKVGDLSWQTSELVGGTPRAKNSEPTVQSSPSTPPPEQPTLTPTPQPEPTPPSVSTHSTNSGQASSPQATSTPPSEVPPPLPPQDQTATKVLISEVMAGSSESSDYEFIEIYNPGSAAIDLTGWTMKKKTSSGSESTLVVASRLEGKSILPGKYLLLAHEEGYTGSVSADIWWPKSYTLAYTNNSVLIYNASGSLVDQVSWPDIPKDKSYERSSLTEDSGFSVQATPNPQNSQE